MFGMFGMIGSSGLRVKRTSALRYLYAYLGDGRVLDDPGPPEHPREDR